MQQSKFQLTLSIKNITYMSESNRFVIRCTFFFIQVHSLLNFFKIKLIQNLRNTTLLISFRIHASPLEMRFFLFRQSHFLI